MAWNYSEKTKQLFLNAVHGKPGTHLGEIKDPDGFGEHGSIVCGDAMRFTFRVKKHPTDPTGDIITEAKYLTFGCTSAIASSEALCTIIEQGEYTPITALNIKNDDIVNFLEGLPAQKIHCSVMGAEALEAAVFNWAQKRHINLKDLGINIHADQKEGRIVCHCFSVSEPYLRLKIKEMNLRTIPEITAAVKAGGACTSCHHEPGGLQDILDDIWSRADTEPETPKPVETVTKADKSSELSPYQFSKQVEKVIDEYIRPMLQKDGGDLEIVDIKGKKIYCQLTGACAGCCAANITLEKMVEKILKENVDEQIKVIGI